MIRTQNCRIVYGVQSMMIMIFFADNPIELLGLISIYKFRKPTNPTSSWWRSDSDSGIYDKLVDAAYPGE